MHAHAIERYFEVPPITGRGIAIWVHRMRTRRRLAELDGRALDDVGLSERERCRECAKWFWQA